MDFKNIKEKFKSFIEHLRGLDEQQKKTIILVIVVILGLIMGFFWLRSAVIRLGNFESMDLKFSGPEMPEIFPSNTQSEAEFDTTDWQTYENSEYGFKISYPKEASLKEIDSSTINIYLNGETNRLDFRISAFANDEQYKTIDELILGEQVKQNHQELTVFSTIPQNYTKTNLDNTSSIEWNTFHETAGKIGITSIVLKDEYYYEITARSDPLDGGYISEFTEENNKILREILSTFKFTNNSEIK